MGLRTFLKRILGKTETAIDVAGDKFDDVSATVKKTGTLIADDASDFARKTINNIKDASGDLKAQSKEAAKDFKERSKQDYNEVKDIAEKQMKETSAFVKEKVSDLKETFKEEKTDLEEKADELKTEAENKLDEVSENIKSSAGAILILLMVGALAGTWLVSGIIPAMIYYGLQILSPSVFLPASLIICSIISISIFLGFPVSVRLLGIKASKPSLW